MSTISITKTAGVSPILASDINTIQAAVNNNHNTAVKLTGDQDIAGIKTFSDSVKTDTISEETAAAGVTVDGVLMKDSIVHAEDIQMTNSSWFHINYTDSNPKFRLTETSHEHMNPRKVNTTYSNATGSHGNLYTAFDAVVGNGFFFALNGSIATLTGTSTSNNEDIFIVSQGIMSDTQLTLKGIWINHTSGAFTGCTYESSFAILKDDFTTRIACDLTM